jgi:hypothetical protein
MDQQTPLTKLPATKRARSPEGSPRARWPEGALGWAQFDADLLDRPCPKRSATDVSAPPPAHCTALTQPARLPGRPPPWLPLTSRTRLRTAGAGHCV